MASPAIIKALRKFTTCDIGDALVRLKVPYGGYLSGLKMYSAPHPNPHFQMDPTSKILGPAYTVRMVHASDKTSPTLSMHFADNIPKGSVVFVSQPKGLISACWGGLMSTRAKNAGAAGVVVDGRFRDVLEHRDLGMGLFARGSSILGSNTFTRAAGLDVPLRFRIEELEDAEVKVRPGDLIMGDADGVVVIPPELASELIETCEARWQIDEETRSCLEKGDLFGPTIKRLRKG
ncbi:gb [Venturia nashicola]|uniref:Gb n=1 Tax=Venturia nashicola TaxID=86259 RepID=A0A4Z1P2J0_9PEZI|nr:gb [Venturia nashicola]TLD35725.1 gb [Venturia nashicola]